MKRAKRSHSTSKTSRTSSGQEELVEDERSGTTISSNCSSRSNCNYQDNVDANDSTSASRRDYQYTAMADSMISMVSGLPAIDTESFVTHDDYSTAEAKKMNRKASLSRSRSRRDPDVSRRRKHEFPIQAAPTQPDPTRYTSVSKIELVRNSSASHSTTGSKLTWLTYIAALIAVICAVVIMRSSTLFLGMLCGSFLTYTLLRTFTSLFGLDTVTVYLPPIEEVGIELPANTIQSSLHNANDSKEESIGEFQGWMNMLEGRPYVAGSYHINNTETVFVRLEGTHLRLKKPLEADIPKRALWNEPVHSVTFVKQVQFNLRNFIVELLPRDLSENRLFSKRFPICLTQKISSNKVMYNKQADSVFNSTTSANKNPDAIILFARTGREKEEWYRRLDQASRGYPVSTLILELQRLVDIEINREERDSEYQLKRKNSAKSSSEDNISLRRKKQQLFDRDHKQLLVDYMRYITNHMAKSYRADTASPCRGYTSDSQLFYHNKDIKVTTDKTYLTTSKVSGFLSLPRPATKQSSTTSEKDTTNLAYECDTGTMWINALLQRIFFDFFREQYWASKVKHRIQKKLDKLNLPYYLSQLTIGDINLGTSLPLIRHIGQPWLSDDGFWIDFHLAYNGGFTMSIETKINLNVLKKGVEKMKTQKPVQTAVKKSRNESSEDSSTSSEDTERINTGLDGDPKKGNHTITKIFDSLKESKYFQKLADTKLIKSAMDKVSNTKLKLTVELKYLTGVGSINITPPPTDRLWFGFRGPPKTVISAKPVVGEKSVNLAKLSAWIEDKLTLELQRELVIPNMIDYQIKLMCGNYKYITKRKQKVKRSASAVTTTTTTGV